MPERSGSGGPTRVSPGRARGRTALKRLGVITLLAGCAWAGWGLAQRSGDRPGADQRQVQASAAATTEVSQLQGQLGRGAATALDRQRLLSLLLGLDRQAEAISLLEQMADQEPGHWPLRLLLADLRRNANDRRGAEREVRQILNQDPGHIEALQRMALLQLEQGRGREARAQLQDLLEKARKPILQPQALAIGLLLADLMQRQGDLAAAAELNQQLSGAFPKDARPWLALALVRQQQGADQASQRALVQARSRLGGPGAQRLDQVAVSWGLADLRGPSGAPARISGPGAVGH